MTKNIAQAYLLGFSVTAPALLQVDSTVSFIDSDNFNLYINTDGDCSISKINIGYLFINL